ncbi:hypothetical protein CP97_14748 [Aurantiacibacter atlanticus]|uniref:Uncharacterized protein n=1 Tax=Aurantiacibacter atlanticus TaxID=1648404 RepID=A0A161IGC4_9SPHN|nr:hypothetical protein CP97_14748 [Aurantiacibacter atlanticus]
MGALAFQYEICLSVKAIGASQGQSPQATAFLPVSGKCRS